MPTQRWTVAFALAASLHALPGTGQSSLHQVDFGDAGGVAVKGLGTIHPLLAIDATQDVQTAVAGANPAAYAGGGDPLVINGCIAAPWSAAGFFAIGAPPSFATNTRVHDYVLTFAPGLTVSELTLRMLDWGDFLPLGACPDNTCGAGIVAYDAADNEIASDELTFTSSSNAQSNRPTDEFGGLAVAGDACLATDGQPGRVLFTVAAPGIAKVVFAFRNMPSTDQLVGFNELSFEVEQPLVVVTASPGLTTSEAGGTASFTVALAWQPAAPVEIEVDSGNAAEGLLSTGGGTPQASLTLTFTDADWDSPQTVTVHGQDDALDDGDAGYTVAVGVAAASRVPPLEDFDPSDVTLTNTDDDSPGIELSQTTVTTSEPDGTDSFTVALAAQPAGDVTVRVTTGDVTEGRVSSGASSQEASMDLVFAPADWSTPRTVTVHGQDDLLADGDVGYDVTVAVHAAPADPGYAALAAQTVAATNLDDETSPEDTDGDGVPDTIEQAGPNGGDGNGDGTPDLEQAAVASLPAASGGVDLTVIATCELRDVAAVALAALPPQSFAFPWGLVEFRLPCASAELEVLFHGAGSWPADVQYRKYGPVTPGDAGTAAWYTLPGVSFDTALVAAAAVPRASFTLTDGALGDDTAVDGWIVDQGGPGMPPAEIPTLSGWLLMAMAALLGSAGAVALRR